MIKGVRWNFVVLFLAVSVWVVSSLSVKTRQKRQMENAFFLQPLRNGRYLPPIPIQFPPYFNSGSESARKSSISSAGSEHSPWIPLQSRTGEEINNKNVYVPPIRPPAKIVTRKPPKTTFDIPLTKSIQVSNPRSNIQTTGYVRKNLIKVHATRTTTEHPRQKMGGTFAESTVQTILNFTQGNEGWKPKGIPTTRKTVIPNINFRKNLGAKVDKHLNYTGLRFGKINTVMETMPQNGVAVKLSKNETNFVMKFTPEDVKFTSVEVKTEKVDTPFSVESPEVKHLTEDFDERRSFFDGFSDPHKTTTDLRNEGNIPYQGHKTSMENTPAIKSGSLHTKTNDTAEVHKTIFDIFPNIKEKNKDMIKEIRLSGQGPSTNIPFGSEMSNKPFRVRNRDPDQTDRAFVTRPSDNQGIKYDGINEHVSNDNRNFFLHSSNVYGIGSDQQAKSNLPYQGHINKPQVSINSDTNEKNNLPGRESQSFLHRPSSKPMIARGETIKNKQPDDQKITSSIPFKSSPQYTPNKYSENSPFIHNKDSIPVTSSNSDTNQYDSVSNHFPTNRTVEKDAITVIKVPLTAEIQYDKINSPNTTIIEETVKNNHGNGDNENKKFKHSSSYTHIPKPPSVISITHEDVSSIYEDKKNDFIKEDRLSSRPAFEQVPKLKEVELMNPPKYLQFQDEDFLKPVSPLNYENEHEEDKSLSAVTFPFNGRSEEVVRQNSFEDKGTLRLLKVSKSFPSQTTSSKVEYYKNSNSEEKRPSGEAVDSTYFQPVFPDTSAKVSQDISQQKFQNYNSEPSSLQSSEGSKKESSKTSLINSVKDNSKSHETVGEKYPIIRQKISKDVIITKDTNYSPVDSRRNNVQRGQPIDFPEAITPPPVITINYDSVDNDQNEKESLNRRNRTENYVIQRKPALLPESSGRPRKPKITLSTGMLAGILIAALVFLGFLTGSMVYAFHQWKFGRKRSDRQKKKARTPGFPPEYLDENFAGNTYIHNNIFLPTPQNSEDRSPSDPDNSSMLDEVAHEQPSTSSRSRRHRTFREPRDE